MVKSAPHRRHHKAILMNTLKEKQELAHQGGGATRMQAQRDRGNLRHVSELIFL